MTKEKEKPVITPKPVESPRPAETPKPGVTETLLYEIKPTKTRDEIVIPPFLQEAAKKRPVK